MGSLKDAATGVQSAWANPALNRSKNRESFFTDENRITRERTY